MKIIEKAVIPVQTCSTCHSKIQLEYKDIRHKLKTPWLYPGISVKHEVWRCPLCKHQNYVKWQDDES